MKTLYCRLFSLAVLGMLVAVPAAADDAGVFQLGQGVTVGSVELPAGAYMFRVSARGLVLVYDEKQTTVVAAVLTQRHALKWTELEMSGTLAHDWAVRKVTLGDWQYTFCPVEKPVTVASRPNVTTVVALAR
jgi:hypothetical protein